LSTLERQISEDRKFKNSPTLECKSIATTGNASARKKITYPGTGNNSQFSFDPLGRNVGIVEQANSSVTSAKTFVWCEDLRCEERNDSGGIIQKLYPAGQATTSTNSYYTIDHLGSTREMTSSGGAIEAQYSIDPFGKVAKLQGSQIAAYQFAHYYCHSASGLNLTFARAYFAQLGRFINRDPSGLDGGINLYAYAANNPISFIDPSGRLPDVAQLPQYGNWGGKGKVAGSRPRGGEISNFPYKKGDKGFKPPIDPRDLCYYRHDVCLHNCARIANRWDRQRCRRNCDLGAACCLEDVQSRFGFRSGVTNGEIAAWRGEQPGQPGAPNDNPGEYDPKLLPYDPDYLPEPINPRM